MQAPPQLSRHWLLRALDLETNRHFGPGRLATEAVQAFREAATEAWTPEADPDEARARLQAYAARLRRSRPCAPMALRLDRCVRALQGDRETALAELQSILTEAEQAEAAVVQSAATLLRPGVRVLTYGFSESVERVLTRHGDRLQAVTVCECRPLNDGLRLATSLADLALPVRLITEAQLELFVQECDLALVEVDRVLPDRSVVARAGTAVLARLCAAYRVPFYVLAERARWVPERDELAHFAPERRAPTEIVLNPPPGVEIVNVAFDLTPASLVAGYVGEEGVVTACG